MWKTLPKRQVQKGEEISPFGYRIPKKWVVFKEILPKTREKSSKKQPLCEIRQLFAVRGPLSAGWQGGLADAAVQENTDAFLSGEKHPAPFRSGAGCYKASKKCEQMAQHAIKKIQGWQDSAG